ncbi:hypothetical protein GCM10008025_22940 [Ornithinibacillus halotolerans]|uniref:Uncharacterized protein n=1 Tax=Ornithinibacillus halotolerans TaxID=1274357 RepID=A0A916S2U0_9BACI|nr:hypothetical protein GCM10008025_22940 [Ornithinibacillus halotolerans]
MTNNTLIPGWLFIIILSIGSGILIPLLLQFNFWSLITGFLIFIGGVMILLSVSYKLFKKKRR